MRPVTATLLAGLVLLQLITPGRAAPVLVLSGEDGTSRLGVGGSLLVTITASENIVTALDVLVTVASSDSSVISVATDETQQVQIGQNTFRQDQIIRFDNAATGAGLVKTFTLNGVGKGDAHITLKSSNIQGVRNRPNTFATPAESASVFGDDLRFTVSDPESLSLTTDSTLNNMGIGGTLGVTVTISANPGVFTAVNVVSSDTATWTTSPASVSFGPGQLEQTFYCTGQGVGSADLTLQSTDTSRIISAVAVNSFASFTAKQISITHESASNLFGETGTLALVITASGQPGKTVTVDVATSDSGVASVSPISLVFTDSVLTHNLVLTGHSAGTIKLLIESRDNFRIASTSESFEIVAARELTVQYDATQPTLGATGSLIATVKCSGNPGNPVTINVASSVTDAFTVSPSTIEFADGELSKQVTITGVSAGAAELTLTSQDLTKVATPSNTQFTVIEPRTISVVSDSTADNIGVGGTMQLTYTLDNIPGNPVSVAVASSDTGAFTVSPSSIQFSDSVLVQTITVTGVGASTASIVLTSSDTPRVATFSKDFVSFEGRDLTVTTDSTHDTVGATGSITVTVALSGVPGNPVSFTLSGSSGNWDVNPSVLQFSDSVTTGTVTISGVSAGVSSLSLQSSDTSRVKSLAGFDVTTIEPRTLTVVSSAASYELGESGSLIATITASAETGNPVTVDVTSSDSARFVVSPSVLTFGGDQQLTQTVTLNGASSGTASLVLTSRDMSRLLSPSTVSFSVITARTMAVSHAAITSAMIGVCPTIDATCTSGDAYGTIKVQIALSDNPGNEVEVAVTSSDTSVWAVSPSQVTFSSLVTSAVLTLQGVGAGSSDLVLTSGEPARILSLPVAETYEVFNARSLTLTGLHSSRNPATESVSSLGATGTMKATVTCSGLPGKDTVVQLSSSATSVFTISPSSVTFTDTELTHEVTLTGSGAGSAVLYMESAESSRINGNTPNGQAFSVFAARTLTVTTTATSFKVGENGQLDITVTCSGDPGVDVIVHVTTESAAHMTASVASLTFSPTALTHTFSVSGILASSGVDLVFTSEEQVRIKHKMRSVEVIVARMLSVVGIESSLTVPATGSLEATVTCSADPGKPIIVDIMSGEDTKFTVSPSTLEFSNAVLTRQITLTGAGDAIGAANIVMKSRDDTRIANSNSSFTTIAARTVATSSSFGTFSVPIGDELTVQATMSGAPGRSVTMSVQFVTDDGSASEGSISADPTTLTFTDSILTHDITLTGVTAGLEKLRLVSAEEPRVASFESSDAYGSFSTRSLIAYASGSETTVPVGDVMQVEVMCSLDPGLPVAVSMSSSDAGMFTVTPAVVVFRTGILTHTVLLKGVGVGTANLQMVSSNKNRIADQSTYVFESKGPLAVALEVPSSSTHAHPIIGVGGSLTLTLAGTNSPVGAPVAIAMSSSDSDKPVEQRTFTINLESVLFEDKAQADYKEAVIITGQVPGEAELLFTSGVVSRIHSPSPLQITTISARTVIFSTPLLPTLAAQQAAKLFGHTRVVGSIGATEALDITINGVPGSDVPVTFSILDSAKATFSADGTTYFDSVTLTFTDSKLSHRIYMQGGVRGVFKVLATSSDPTRITSGVETLFDCIDLNAPVVDSTIPADASKGIAIGLETITVHFDEEVQFGSGSIQITDPSGTLDEIAIPDSTGRVNITGSVMTVAFHAFTPTPLGHVTLFDKELTKYTMTLPAGTITDTAPTINPMPVVAFTFTTEADLVLPFIIDRLPESGSTSVCLSNKVCYSSFTEAPKLVVTFSKSVSKESGDIVVTRSIAGGGSEVTATIPITALNVKLMSNTYDGAIYWNKLEITLDHTSFGTELSQYDVLLSPGVVKDVSAGQNKFAGGAGDYTLTAAKDEVRPFITTTTPINAKTKVPLQTQTLTAVFSEPVVLKNGTVRLYQELDGLSPVVVQTMNITDPNAVALVDDTTLRLTLTPNVLRHEGAAFYIEVDASVVADLAYEPNTNVAVEGNADWRFATDFRSHMRVGSGAEIHMGSGKLEFHDL